MSNVFQLLTKKKSLCNTCWESFRNHALVKWRQQENRKLRWGRGREGRAGHSPEAPLSFKQGSLGRFEHLGRTFHGFESSCGGLQIAKCKGQSIRNWRNQTTNSKEMPSSWVAHSNEQQSLRWKNGDKRCLQWVGISMLRAGCSVGGSGRYLVPGWFQPRSRHSLPMSMLELTSCDNR